MALLHEPAVRDELKRRVQSLRSDSRRRWGRMTVDQMLWHVSLPMAEALGEYSVPPHLWLVPRRVFRWIMLNLPWPKGVITRPDLRATRRHDFDAMRARCLDLIDRVAARDIHGQWSPSASFGRMRGEQWSWFLAQHLYHHLRQFGA